MQQEDFYKRLAFKDRPSDDCERGPARTVDITARCTDCWGAVSVATDDPIHPLGLGNLTGREELQLRVRPPPCGDPGRQ